MAERTDLLIAFCASFDRMERARAGCDDLNEIRHAERNFYANAESLARLVPRLIDSSPAEQERAPAGLLLR